MLSLLLALGSRCHCVAVDVTALAHPRSAASEEEPWKLLQDLQAVVVTIHQSWDMPHLALFIVLGFNGAVTCVGS